MPTVHLPDGRVVHFPYDMAPEAIQAEVEKMVAPSSGTNAPSMGTPDQEPEGSGGGPSLGAMATGLAAARAVPGIVRGSAQFAANHPAAIQKTIGAGMTALGGTIGGGVGAGIGGPTGAVIGAITGSGVRGLTPSQATIRTVAGRLAGEAPDVAKEAGRAIGIQEYIKNTSGLKVKPTDILSKSAGLPAAEEYAKSQGRGILKILGPSGEVVAGPTAASPTAARQAPGMIGRMAGSRVAGALGQAAKFATGAGTSALLASTDVNRRLNSPETLEAVNELRRPMGERQHQNPYRDQVLARLAAMLGY